MIFVILGIIFGLISGWAARDKDDNSFFLNMFGMCLLAVLFAFIGFIIANLVFDLGISQNPLFGITEITIKF